MHGGNSERIGQFLLDEWKLHVRGAGQPNDLQPQPQFAYEMGEFSVRGALADIYWQSHSRNTASSASVAHRNALAIARLLLAHDFVQLILRQIRHNAGGDRSDGVVLPWVLE